MVSPRGKCWFGVDSKTFEISIGEVKGKVSGRESARGAQTSLPGSASVVKVWPSCWKGLRPATVSR